MGEQVERKAHEERDGVRDQHCHHGGPNNAREQNRCGLRLQDKTLYDISNYYNKNWVSFFGIMRETESICII